jgi:hypothetical protein
LNIQDILKAVREDGFFNNPFYNLLNKENKTIYINHLFPILSCMNKQDVDYEKGINKSLTAFIKDIKSKKIENAVNYIYAKYLDKITREQVINMLNFAYNNPTLMVDINDFKIDNIEKPELINDEYFSMTNYSFEMNLKHIGT